MSAADYTSVFLRAPVQLLSQSVSLFTVLAVAGIYLSLVGKKCVFRESVPFLRVKGVFEACQAVVTGWRRGCGRGWWKTRVRWHCHLGAATRAHRRLAEVTKNFGLTEGLFTGLLFAGDVSLVGEQKVLTTQHCSSPTRENETPECKCRAL